MTTKEESEGSAASAIQIVTKSHYRLDDRATFERELAEMVSFRRVKEEISAALIERSRGHEGSHVLWDPFDGDDGFMLVGNEPEALAAEAVKALDLS